MSAADRLNEIEARANAATKGPWIVASCENERTVETKHQRWHVASYTSPDNANFIADARSDVPDLVAALRAVLDLHRTGPGEQDWCVDCGETSPCQTVRAIEEALNA